MEKEASIERFMSWRDLIITPLVFLFILLSGFGATYGLHCVITMPLLLAIVVFFVIQSLIAILVVRLIHLLFPLKPGIYTRQNNPVLKYIYNLQGFILITNLFFFYHLPVFPPPFRKMFYQVLGSKVGKGIISIAGLITDPLPLITIEESVVIGINSVILPHVQMSVEGEDVLILAEIKIKKGAIIGVNAVLMPGVTVGENAVVNALSFVPMNTTIGPNEVWGGNPAKKISGPKESGS